MHERAYVYLACAYKTSLKSFTNIFIASQILVYSYALSKEIFINLYYSFFLVTGVGGKWTAVLKDIRIWDTSLFYAIFTKENNFRELLLALDDVTL